MRADYSDVRGFNYQQSSGTTSLENWLYFDPDLFEVELRRGKEYFPAFNTVRLWLSWDAYERGPAEFLDTFEAMLSITDRLGLKVIACLFNRWHDRAAYDNGGVYLDHFITTKEWCHYVPRYETYVRDVVGRHSGDPRILIWDICNEPMPYDVYDDEIMPFVEPELAWLRAMHAALKEADGVTPVGISSHNNLAIEGLSWLEPMSDVLLIHPYFIYDDATELYDADRRARYEEWVARYAEYGRSVGKPVLVTETAWGHEDDDERVECLRFTLGTLAKHGIGFLPHALHYSGVADLHHPIPGTEGDLYMAFVSQDGTLRPGHEAFNEF